MVHILDEVVEVALDFGDDVVIERLFVRKLHEEVDIEVGIKIDLSQQDSSAEKVLSDVSLPEVVHHPVRVTSSFLCTHAML